MEQQKATQQGTEQLVEEYPRLKPAVAALKKYNNIDTIEKDIAKQLRFFEQSEDKTLWGNKVVSHSKNHDYREFESVYLQQRWWREESKQPSAKLQAKGAEVLKVFKIEDPVVATEDISLAVKEIYTRGYHAASEGWVREIHIIYETDGVFPPHQSCKAAGWPSMKFSDLNCEDSGNVVSFTLRTKDKPANMFNGQPSQKKHEPKRETETSYGIPVEIQNEYWRSAPSNVGPIHYRGAPYTDWGRRR